jgi:hypothetical protein
VHFTALEQWYLDLEIEKLRRDSGSRNGFYGSPFEPKSFWINYFPRIGQKISPKPLKQKVMLSRYIHTWTKFLDFWPL